MIEYERTYLAKYIPKDIQSCKQKEISDMYIPATQEHPTLRIRKNGDTYEMTKKEPVRGTDSSMQEEQTIELTKEEFEVLARVPGKRVHKVRYYSKKGSERIEIDIFQGHLKGLVLVDVEFLSEEEKDKSAMPEFCLADVTQEKEVAGGMLCGKSYSDIEKFLKRYGYKPLSL